MSYEFTKLSEVPAVSEFPEGANAIIETNGEIKRCPSSGGSSVPAAGGVTTLHINVTAVNGETKEATFTADKTPMEMRQAAVNGPVWCVVTFAAGVVAGKALSCGVPPAWYTRGQAFGGSTDIVHEDNGNNINRYFVRESGSGSWIVDLTGFGG